MGAIWRPLEDFVPRDQTLNARGAKGARDARALVPALARPAPLASAALRVSFASPARRM